MFEPARHSTQATIRQWFTIDRRNLLLIVAGWLLCVLLMPPTRNFAYVDDWVYSQAAERIWSGQGFIPPDYVSPTLVAHAYWGAAFAWLFGFNFTTLTWATLVLSLIALISFYLLLRLFGFSPYLSLVGTAVLAVNPLFITYSYTYMTDITFLSLMLLSSLCYTRAVTSNAQLVSGDDLKPVAIGNVSYSWLVLGSLFASLAFLVRQFGLALPVAMLLWLLWSRRLRWQQLLAAGLLPAVTAGSYLLWSRGFPLNSAGVYQQTVQGEWLNNPLVALQFRLNTVLYGLPLLGLTIPLFVRVRHWWLALPWFTMIALAIYALPLIISQEGSVPNTLSSYKPLWLLGAALAAWLLASLSERTYSMLARLQTDWRPPPVYFLYILTLLLLVGTFFVSRYWYPRYSLPLLPALIVLALLFCRSYAARLQGLSWAIIVLVALYSSVNHLESYAFTRLSWQAASNLVNEGVSLDHLDGGYAWNGYYMYDESMRRLRGQPLHAPDAYPPDLVIDPQYRLAIAIQPGYRVVQSYSYFSPLSGFRDNTLLVLRRQE